jgi:hypothetical protein
VRTASAALPGILVDARSVLRRSPFCDRKNLPVAGVLEDMKTPKVSEVPVAMARVDRDAFLEPAPSQARRESAAKLAR